jgi:hypothetical protein
MSKDVVVILLVAMAGILVGGVYSTWKTTKGLAVVLAVAAALALGAAVAWYLA